MRSETITEDDLKHSRAWRRVSGKLWCTRYGRWHDGLKFLQPVPYWLARTRNPLGQWSKWKVRAAILVGKLAFDPVQEVHRVWTPDSPQPVIHRKTNFKDWVLSEVCLREIEILDRLGVGPETLAQQYDVPLPLVLTYIGMGD